MYLNEGIKIYYRFVYAILRFLLVFNLIYIKSINILDRYFINEII